MPGSSGYHSLFAVMAMNPVSKRRISHVGPVALIESRGILERFPANVENEFVLLRVKPQRTPWHGKQLVAER
jgi:hypothetical protein